MVWLRCQPSSSLLLRISDPQLTVLHSPGRSWNESDSASCHPMSTIENTNKTQKQIKLLTIWPGSESSVQKDWERQRPSHSWPITGTSRGVWLIGKQRFSFECSAHLHSNCILWIPIAEYRSEKNPGLTCHLYAMAPWKKCEKHGTDEVGTAVRLLSPGVFGFTSRQQPFPPHAALHSDATVVQILMQVHPAKSPGLHTGVVWPDCYSHSWEMAGFMHVYTLPKKKSYKDFKIQP